MNIRSTVILLALIIVSCDNNYETITPKIQEVVKTRDIELAVYCPNICKITLNGEVKKIESVTYNFKYKADEGDSLTVSIEDTNVSVIPMGIKYVLIELDTIRDWLRKEGAVKDLTIKTTIPKTN